MKVGGYRRKFRGSGCCLKRVSNCLRTAHAARALRSIWWERGRRGADSQCRGRRGAGGRRRRGRGRERRGVLAAASVEEGTAGSLAADARAMPVPSRRLGRSQLGHGPLAHHVPRNRQGYSAQKRAPYRASSSSTGLFHPVATLPRARRRPQGSARAGAARSTQSTTTSAPPPHAIAVLTVCMREEATRPYRATHKHRSSPPADGVRWCATLKACAAPSGVLANDLPWNASPSMT